jgi:hypothetical protein
MHVLCWVTHECLLPGDTTWSGWPGVVLQVGQLANPVLAGTRWCQ